MLCQTPMREVGKGVSVIRILFRRMMNEIALRTMLIVMPADMMNERVKNHVMNKRIGFFHLLLVFLWPLAATGLAVFVFSWEFPFLSSRQYLFIRVASASYALAAWGVFFTFLDSLSRVLNHLRKVAGRGSERPTYYEY